MFTNLTLDLTMRSTPRDLSTMNSSRTQLLLLHLHLKKVNIFGFNINKKILNFKNYQNQMTLNSRLFSAKNIALNTLFSFYKNEVFKKDRLKKLRMFPAVGVPKNKKDFWAKKWKI